MIMKGIFVRKFKFKEDFLWDVVVKGVRVIVNGFVLFGFDEDDDSDEEEILK